MSVPSHYYHTASAGRWGQRRRLGPQRQRARVLVLLLVGRQRRHQPGTAFNYVSVLAAGPARDESTRVYHNPLPFQPRWGRAMTVSTTRPRRRLFCNSRARVGPGQGRFVDRRSSDRRGALAPFLRPCLAPGWAASAGTRMAGPIFNLVVVPAPSKVAWSLGLVQHQRGTFCPAPHPGQAAGPCIDGIRHLLNFSFKGDLRKVQ